MKKNTLFLLLKVIAFCLVLCIVFYFVAIPFIDPYDHRAYEWSRSMAEERENALDVVFIGSSNTYAFFNPLLAWKYYGIATHTYAFSSQKSEAFRYMIEEARKTQPNAVYVISLGNPALRVSLESIHYLTDYMPFSLNKLHLALAYAKYNNYTKYQALQLLLPFILYHSRWDSLTSSNFKHPRVAAKGVSRYYSYLQMSTDISSIARIVTDRSAMSEEQMEVITDLIDYIKENDLHVVFLDPPQMGTSDSKLAVLNTELDLLRENGFTVLPRQDYLDEVAYDFTRDYYNENHTNIHGATKYTDYISRFLIEQFGLEDKRGDPAYSDFDAAYEEYYQLVAPYVLDFELEVSARDHELNAPEEMALEQLDDAVALSWADCPGADGYLVYRQDVLFDPPSEDVDGDADGDVDEEGERLPWERIADLDASVREYLDTAVELGNSYGYTVVPYSVVDGTVRYGSFDQQGIIIEVMENDGEHSELA